MNSVHEQCPQTVTQNSVLSQDWVGSTGALPEPNLRAQAERTTPKPAVSRLCRGPFPGRIVAEPGRVAARMHALARRVVALCRAPRSQYKNCIATLALAARRVAAPLRHVAEPLAPYRSRWPHCIVTRGRPSATIQSFVLRLSPWPSHARAHSVARPCAWVDSVVALTGRVPALPRRVVACHCAPLRAPARPGLTPWPCLSSPVSQYSLLYCDSNLEKWAVAHSSSTAPFLFFLFFHSFFFSLFQLLENHQIYIYIYIYIYNKINLIK